MADGPDRLEARRRYDRLAADFDCCLGVRSSRLVRMVEGLRKRAVARLELRPGQTVIDVGCGTGDSFARLVSAVGARGCVVGVDQSGGMLERAARRISAQGWTNVQLLEAAVQEARLPDADAALFFFTHDLLRSPVALDHVIGALRPGGHVVAAGAKRPSHWLARIAVPTRRIMRRYTTTDDGIDEPWDLLAERLLETTCETLVLGTLYVATGRRPAPAVR